MTIISCALTTIILVNLLMAGRKYERQKPLDSTKADRLNLLRYMDGMEFENISNQDSFNEEFWQQNLVSPQLVSWRGLAFENVCFLHIPQIKKALGISGVSTMQSAWSKRDDDEEGTQIDLLILCRDNVVNMCELKFYSDDFSVDSTYFRTLQRREMLLAKNLPRKC